MQNCVQVDKHSKKIVSFNQLLYFVGDDLKMMVLIKDDICTILVLINANAKVLHMDLIRRPWKYCRIQIWPVLSRKWWYTLPCRTDIWSEKGDWRNQYDEDVVSIITFGMSESSGFQKYSICWVFQALCLCLCLCICVLLWFLNSFHHKLSEYV